MAKRPKKSKGRPAWLVFGVGSDASVMPCVRVQTITLEDGRRMCYVNVRGTSRLIPAGELFVSHEEALREVVKRHDKSLEVLQSVRDSYARDMERLEELRKAMKKGLGDD